MLNAESPCQMIVEECAKVKLVDSLAKTFAQFDNIFVTVDCRF